MPQEPYVWADLRCDFANYLADFVANYLAKIGELFGIIDTRSIK